MVAGPPDKPETMPVDPTVAVPVALLLHVPPTVKSPSVIVAPVQTKVLPVMPAGVTFTVTGSAIRQPVGSM